MHRIRTALAAFAVAMVAVPAAAADIPRTLADFAETPGSRDYARLLQAIKKPSGPAGGDDSCQHANDMECDEPGFGTGACAAGTDYSDCWRIMTGAEDDSCQWANDGECDEPFFGTGACTQGTDLSDCGDVTHLRFRDDSCARAFDGVCDEPETGTGLCEARTDRTDCGGRERPMTINDHFFGSDDRRLMDTAAWPWRAVGQVTFDASDSACTASLVAPNVIVTAAHCISGEGGRIDAAGVFETGRALSGGPRSARVVDYLIDPLWDDEAFSAGDDLDGTDWALLRLDAPIGDQVGVLGVETLQPGDRATLSQAGFSWDTGDNLSGNARCSVLEVYADNTLSHDCDTTRGDSGSPFLVERGGDWFVVATDSNFRSAEDAPFVYIAALSNRWGPLVDDFSAGRTGEGGTRPRGPGKPEPLKPVKTDE